ncbi:RIF1 [Candida theae]|uniref:RIF1 n=1 Tax=Candida theae TaxID=1198502 RepID=A0AAD5BCD8_9ASCO|nr:RIF1 [Candida theae]KAI5954784.1 RIF1 [Candida theae]
MAPVRRSTRTAKARNSSPKKQNSSPLGAKRRSNRKNRSSREKSPSVELNSSPIKKLSTQQDLTPTKQKCTPKSRKTVLFSDDLVSDLPSTPDRCSTPMRSILKPSNVNIPNGGPRTTDALHWADSKYAEFWLPGTIVQAPLGSEGLSTLVAGCLSVLSDENFNRRFEVYGSLNSIFRANTVSVVRSFTKESESTLRPLVTQIIIDIQKSEEEIYNSASNKENQDQAKCDPFKIRTLTQSLKLLSQIMSHEDLNNSVSMETIFSIYELASTSLVHPTISKAAISPYLSIIKDCKLNASRRRELFHNQEVLGKMLFAVLNFKSFPSASLVTERLCCLKNYVLNFPEFMAKSIDSWLVPLMLSLLNMNHPVYIKSISVGVYCLLEAAKCFLDNSDVHEFVSNQFLSPVTDNVKLFIPAQEFSGNIERLENARLSEFVVHKLRELLLADSKLAMDMWMGLTLLAGGEKFEKCTDLNLWLTVPGCCFSMGHQATALAISCYRAICFNLCKNGLADFRKAIDSTQFSASGDEKTIATGALRSKVEALIHVFNAHTSKDFSMEVTDSIHNIFLIEIHLILGPSILKSWTKYLPLLWDKIVQPILKRFYLRKGLNAHVHRLAWEVMTALLKSSIPHTEKDFNELRVLSNEAMSLDQVNTLPARFVHTHFDKIMEPMILLYQLDSIKFEQKLSLFFSFLSKVRVVVKKEQNPSPITYDLIDNLPLLLQKLLRTQHLSSEALMRIIVAMHDTFNPSLLINRDFGCDGYDNDINVYVPVIEATNALATEGKATILKLILQSLTHTKALMLVTDVLNLPTVSDDILQIFTEFLNKSSILSNTIDLKFYSIICKKITVNFEFFLKKIIQSIVANPNSSEICKCLSVLHIDEWATHVCEYVLLLLRNAPSKSIHHFVAGVISRRFEGSLVQTLAFVTKNDFASELFLLSGHLFDLVIRLDGSALQECSQLLEMYLRFKSLQGGCDYLLIDILGSGCSKYLHMDISFLQKLVDFSKLPLCSHQVTQRLLNDSRSKEKTVGELANAEKMDGVHKNAVPKNTMAIENLIDGNDNMIERDSGDVQVLAEDFTTVQNHIDVMAQKEIIEGDESSEPPLLTAPDLVKLLSEKTDRELSTITPEQKYELESDLLQFMVRLRQLN